MIIIIIFFFSNKYSSGFEITEINSPPYKKDKISMDFSYPYTPNYPRGQNQQNR